MSDKYKIRRMNKKEVADIAIKWAEKEGWNPGITDAEPFYAADPKGFFIGEIDGKPPDEKAGDNIWTLQVDAPFQAPAGQFNVDLTAYRADGTPVPIRKDGHKQALAVTIPVIIRNP